MTHADHDTLMTRTANDGWENSTGRLRVSFLNIASSRDIEQHDTYIISSETSLAHATIERGIHRCEIENANARE